jgi:hypothetical protein
MKKLLQENKSDIAFVIGNGINQYGATNNTNHWHELLIQLANNFLHSPISEIPAGVTYTEFFDVLELNLINAVPEKSLQQKFCDLMATWTFQEHHTRIVEWAKSNNSPILTTNFEQILSSLGNCTLRRTRREGFTDFYPWESYYSDKDISDPSQEFGIWHVNGMQHYHRSVRLGLSHYMGSVERARRWLHRRDDSKLFGGKDAPNWRGATSWLHIVFNTPLLIFGLKLEENEVFFRWLLIQRAQYFKAYPDRKKKAWYVYTGTKPNTGKEFFLKGVGIEPIRVDSYDEIYGAGIWDR